VGERARPASAVDRLCDGLKVYPYAAGGVGTSFASFPSGDAPLGPVTPPPETVFHDGSGTVMIGTPPADVGFFEYLDEIVQQEPVGTLDPELLSHLAAIGIVKGRPFAPDERSSTRAGGPGRSSRWGEAAGWLGTAVRGGVTSRRGRCTP